jgi:hypothetical protein
VNTRYSKRAQVHRRRAGGAGDPSYLYELEPGEYYLDVASACIWQIALSPKYPLVRQTSRFPRESQLGRLGALELAGLVRG